MVTSKFTPYFPLNECVCRSTWSGSVSLWARAGTAWASRAP